MIKVMEGLRKTKKDDISVPKRILGEYFKCVKKNFYSDWKKGKSGFVKASNGIAIFLGLLSRIAMKEASPDRLDSKLFDKYLERLSGTRWAAFRDQKLSSDSARHDTIKELSKKMKI